VVDREGVRDGGRRRGEETEAYPMVRLQIVYLLPKDEHPEVFAQELYYVQGVGEAGAIFGEPA
jgi:hypothetical protein